MKESLQRLGTYPEVARLIRDQEPVEVDGRTCFLAVDDERPESLALVTCFDSGRYTKCWFEPFIEGGVFFVPWPRCETPV